MERFISENYRPDHILCSRDYFQWLFRISSSADRAPVMCAWEGDELTAILGCLNLTMQWGSHHQDVPAVGLTHWMSSKRAPIGVGWILARKALSCCDLAITLNSSKLGSPFFRSLGWSFRESIPRYLCILDRQRCDILASSTEGRTLDRLVFSPPHSTQNPELIDFANYAPRWELYPQMLFSIKRSSEYLQWRYLEHPVFTYHLLVSGEGHRPAVCVYRIEQAYGIGEGSVGRIVEFFHPDDENGRIEGSMLLYFVLKRLRVVGCAFAEFYCTSEAFGQTILALGGGVEPPGHYVLPSRLTPIQSIRHDINLTFSLPKGLPMPTEAGLYVTRSDIDGDQPVRHMQV